MDYQYKLVVTSKKLYREFDKLPNHERFYLGTTTSCEFRLNPEYFYDDIEICIERTEDIWTLICNDTVYFSNGSVQKYKIVEMKHGDTYKVRYEVSEVDAFEIELMIDFQTQLPDYNYYCNLEGVQEFTIGNYSDCEIVLNSMFNGNNRIRFSRKNKGFFVDALQSRHGVFVNGKRIEGSKFITDFDFISIDDCSFYYRQNYLYFDQKYIRYSTYEKKQIYQDSVFKYPVFVRNARRKIVLNEETISILDPAQKPSEPENNLLITLLPGLAMIIMIIVVRGFMSGSNGGFIIFSVFSMGIGLITSIYTYFHSKKKYKENLEKRTEQYNTYISRKKDEIEAARQEEVFMSNAMYYSPQIGIENVFAFNGNAFDRIREDEDFLHMYIGVGSRESVRKIEYQAKEKLEPDDELQVIPQQIASQYKYVDNVPLYIDLKKANAIGVVGKEQNLYSFFKFVLADLVCRQYVNDFGLFLIISEDDISKYNWIRMLPQLKNGAHGRNVVFDLSSRTNVFDDLYKELSFRLENKGVYKHLVIFVMDETDIINHPISRFIKIASELNVAFIFFVNRIEFVPVYTTGIVELDSSQSGEMYACASSQNRTQFKYQNISDETAAFLVKRLAPVHNEEISLESSLTKNISLYEMLGIFSAYDVNLTRTWNSSQVEKTMAAPLGVDSKGDIVYLDLHEKAHGPHGLVAGTTGSGKSEILQSYILSASMLFSPNEIGFLIIDFKAGGMANQFTDLPHLMGTITNLEGNENIRSLRFIRAELHKRERLFAEAEVNHIDKYIQKFKRGEVRIPLPHLVLIVDEFAELKHDFPEFMDELISTARIGRSLGVHLILATQKPAGQVSGHIWSNSRFKLCLKVQTPEDSNEVLKSPLAAEIREPGRAYFQVGNNEIFELFQSAYSGASDKVNESGTTEFAVFESTLAGRGKPLYVKKNKKSEDRGITQLEAIVRYIHNYVDTNGISIPDKVCLPPLEALVNYPSNASMKDSLISIGIFDDPDNQIQAENYMDFDNRNTLIIGSSQTGKSNLLMSIIRTIAENRSPQQSVFYIIDFGSLTLKNFETLAHVGGVVTLSEDEKLKNLFKLLMSEMQTRKEKMLAKGVSSFASYVEAGYKDMPQIKLIVENYMAGQEIFMNDDRFMTILRDGLSVGISVLLTNSQTSGITYRYVSNFGNKIMMHCNDDGEYVSLLGKRSLTPKDTPGRCILEKDKRIIECQTYLAFEGEREVDRSKEIRAFIQWINKKYAGMKAKRVPYIPSVLTQELLETEFGVQYKPYSFPVGLSYSSVSPVEINVADMSVLGIAGGKMEMHYTFTRQMVNFLDTHPDSQPVDIIVIDDVKKSLGTLQKAKCVSKYSLDDQALKETISEWYEILKDRYENFKQGISLEKDALLMMIINNNDVLKAIDSDFEVNNKLKEMLTTYRDMKFAVLVTDYPNGYLPFDAPVVHTEIKARKHLLYFDKIDTLNVIDLPYDIQKVNRQSLGNDDVFIIFDNDVNRTKMAGIN